MCRLMAYVGQPQLLADIVLWPDRSIIKQSYDARERKIDPTLPFHLGHGNLNGDGFGIGWFSPDERRVRDPSPCVFTSITPAWNNENLSRLACKIVSPLVFAHVRAAYPGMPVSEQNCHPFQFSRYMWMHNGVVAGFAQIRRSLLETLSDCAYNAVASFHSDSAVSFALFLNHLPDVRAQLAPDVLIKAMQDTISTISTIQRRHGITATSLLNFVVSDGATLIATRFVSPESEGPASLYYAEGANFARTPAAPAPAPATPATPIAASAAAPAANRAGGGCPGVQQGGEAAASSAAGPGYAPCSGSANSGSSITQESSYELSVCAQGPKVVFVASEPITASASDWVAVPKNTALVVTREKGGFLNTLRCPLQCQPQPQTLPSPNAPGSLALQGGFPWRRRSSSSGHGGQGPLHPYLDPQRDVCLCLEALSRGITAKSRAFLAHRPTVQGLSGSVAQLQQLQPAPESVQELMSGVPTLVGSGFDRASQVGQTSPLESTNLSALHSASVRTGMASGPSQALSLGLEPPPDPDPHDYMRLVGHTGPVMAMTVCPHTNRLYTSAVDCSVRVWSLRDNSCLHTMIGQRKPVTAMRLRCHGRLLLACSGRKIRVWDTTAFRCLQLIKISDSCGTIRCLEVFGLHHKRHNGPHQHNHSHSGMQSPRHIEPSAGADGAKLDAAEPGSQPQAPAGASGGGSLEEGGLLEANSGRSSWTGEDGMAAYRGNSRRGQYSSMDGGSSGSISLLEALVAHEVTLDAVVDTEGADVGRADSATGVSAEAAGRVSDGGGSAISGVSLLFVGCQDATVKVFTLEEHQLLAAAAMATATAVTVALVPAIDTAAVEPQKAARVQAAAAAANPASRSSSVTTPPPSPFVPARPNSLLPSRTSLTGIVGPPPLLPPRVIATQEETEQFISDLAPLMVTTAEGGAHVGPVNCLTMCGRYLCSGGGDASVRVWDAATLKLVGVLRGHRGSVLCLLGLGSSTLMSGARDNTIRVWDLEMDMMCRRTLTGHKDDVTGLSALPLHRQGCGASAAAAAAATLSSLLTPGRNSGLTPTLVASSSADGTVRLWSTAWNCLCILSLSGPTVPAALCGYLTGDLALAGFSDGEVRLWHIDDVQRHLLQICYNEALAESEALRTACGCVVHGVQAAAVAAAHAAGGGAAGRDAAVQAALAYVQAHGPAGAVAAAASLVESGGRSAVGQQDALSLLSPRGGGGQQRPDAASSPSAAAAVAAVAQPGGAKATGAGAAGQSEITDTDAGRSERGSVISPLGTMDGSAGDAAARGGPNLLAATSPQPPTQLPPSSAEPRSATATITANTSTGPFTAAAAQTAPAAANTGTRPAVSPRSHSLDLTSRPSITAYKPSPNVVGPPGPATGTAAAGAAPVPIHIHGRRSPLTSNSVANMASLLASVAQAGPSSPGAAAAAAPVVGKHFCSTCDQQLEAALRDFVRIKTVSSSPKLRDECHKGAKFLAKMLEGLGADVKVVQVYEDKNPVVIGRLGHNPDRPTVTFYGHYDVQPAAEPDWATNPFELNSVNEYLYGRGVSDNKGPILAFIFAVRELMNSCGDGGAASGGAGAGRSGRLPVNVAFVFEGEEENGSRGFATAVTQNLRWFEGTQLIIISNTLWVGENVPCLTYGMRGMLSLTVQITGPERDLHSGNDGGVFSEPMVDLLRVMATLVGPGGRVQVPGFYDDVEPSLIDLAWTSLEDNEEFSLEGYKAALGVPSLTAPPNKRDLLVTRWCRPSLSVVDMRPGAAAAPGAAAPGGQPEPASTCYRFGPTRFSVIPKAAQGKVSVRFVPNQDADRLVECLRKHVNESFAALGSSNTIDLHVEARGNWWEARQGRPWLAMAEAAIQKEWGVQPLYVREGGTMPVASYLERLLRAPAILIPMGQSSDNCHLANERIRRTNLSKGKNVIRRLLEEIATMDPATLAAQQQLQQLQPIPPRGSIVAHSASAPVSMPASVPSVSLRTSATVAVAASWGPPTAHAGLHE